VTGGLTLKELSINIMRLSTMNKRLNAKNVRDSLTLKELSINTMRPSTMKKRLNAKNVRDGLTLKELSINTMRLSTMKKRLNVENVRDGLTLEKLSISIMKLSMMKKYLNVMSVRDYLTLKVHLTSTMKSSTKTTSHLVVMIVTNSFLHKRRLISTTKLNMNLTKSLRSKKRLIKEKIECLDTSDAAVEGVGKVEIVGLINGKSVQCVTNKYTHTIKFHWTHKIRMIKLTKQRNIHNIFVESVRF
jgi:hypothetical protein